MDMDQAAVFLAGSILTALGFIVILVAIVVGNNILHKYWKPITLWRFDTPPIRFASQEELDRITPQPDDHKK